VAGTWNSEYTKLDILENQLGPMLNLPLHPKLVDRQERSDARQQRSHGGDQSKLAGVQRKCVDA
jgi:hypothetical protein